MLGDDGVAKEGNGDELSKVKSRKVQRTPKHHKKHHQLKNKMFTIRSALAARTLARPVVMRNVGRRAISIKPKPPIMERELLRPLPGAFPPVCS